MDGATAPKHISLPKRPTNDPKWHANVFFVLLIVFLCIGTIVNTASKTHWKWEHGEWQRTFPFHPVVVVLAAETTKLGISSLLVHISNQWHDVGVLIRDWKSVGVAAGCAAVYALQNNLAYWAIRAIGSPGVFHALLSSRVLLSGLIGVVVFGEGLGMRKWAGLLCISVGGGFLAYFHVQHGTDLDTRSVLSGSWPLYGVGLTFLVGFLSASGAALTQIAMHRKVSPHASNIVLYVFGVVANIWIMLIGEGEEEDSGSMLQQGKLSPPGPVQSASLISGWDSLWTWVSIALLSLSGLVVAFLVRATNAQYKQNASVLALAATTILSVVFFGESLSILKTLSILTILIGQYLYTLTTQKQPKNRPYSNKLI